MPSWPSWSIMTGTEGAGPPVVTPTMLPIKHLLGGNLPRHLGIATGTDTNNITYVRAFVCCRPGCR